MLDGHGAGVEEYEGDHEPEPVGGLADPPDEEPEPLLAPHHVLVLLLLWKSPRKEKHY